LQKIIKTKAQLFLHFHQFTKKNKKIQTLQKIAGKNNTFKIFTPTKKLTKIFQIAGFNNCQTIYCPSFTNNGVYAKTNRKFEKIIYAGAARKDKGFPEVIDLLCYLKKQDINLPFEIQISPPNSGRYDKETELAINKLNKLEKENIILHQTTLDQTQYQELFINSICLLIYDNNNYNDKFSGVTLDAFYAGCPIITVGNTWMGDTVKRFNAGIALENRSPKYIFNAINTIIQNYKQYSINAMHAATTLAKEHDPLNTLLAIQNCI
jgi:glycosyltransferase involved in cell wall biosynthesis